MFLGATTRVLHRIHRWSSSSPKKPNFEKAAVSALKIKDASKALQVLTSAPFAPPGPATLKALFDLHPGAPPPAPLPPPPSRPLFFQEDLIKAALASFGAGSGAGLFAYRPHILQQCAQAESDHFLRALSAVVNLLGSGKAPSFLRPFLAGGVSIAFSKPNGGVRPLACGDPFRRLVSKCFCIGAKDVFSAEFAGKNFGVGCKGGVEVVAHTLRDFRTHHTGKGLAALKVDFRNAFNCVDCSAFLSSVHQSFPGMYAWTEWCYGAPPS